LNMPEGTPGKDHVEEITVGARRARDLVNQMLAYTGQGQFELRAINLNRFVKEMADFLQVSRSKNSVLTYDFAGDLPTIEGDTTQIRQVIMNLITNASEAIGDKNGIITITTGTTRCAAPAGDQWADPGIEREYAYLEVTDTGSGMDESTRDKMFEPFFTTKFTGRGLGMSAVEGIVRGHGGSIEVHSQVGRGTTVRVLFPTILVPAEPARSLGAGDSANSADTDWRGTGTVLVVDDEAVVRSLARTVLELMEFQVLEAADGLEAIDIFNENRDDIRAVILDLTMPQMGGEECFRKLRELQQDVCVILSSGYSEQEITRRFAGVGIRGFLQKPYDIETIRTKIREVLEA
ncbi:MAG: response regulator, partial [Gammaproteobacteria bacterium]|nr:response regulator [Gammaproteobacteria bacterium]NNL51910.1 response regulator [Woeseiaceae bacterium]